MFAYCQKYIYHCQISSHNWRLHDTRNFLNSRWGYFLFCDKLFSYLRQNDVERQIDKIKAHVKYILDIRYFHRDLIHS